MSTAVDRPKRNRNVICASSKSCDTSTSLLGPMDSDYGFAPSWPAIPPPSLLPQGRVTEASTVVEEDRKHILGKSKPADSNPDNDVNTSKTGGCAISRPHSPDATLVTVSQQQQQLQPAPAAQSLDLGLAQGHGQQHLKQHHQEQKRQNEEENDAHHPQHYYRCEGEHKEQRQMTSDSCVRFAECVGKSKTAASTSGSCAAAASSDTMSSPTLETAKGSGAIVSPPPSPQREQVSLPEDIYGAARVSEYWHGVHALSSLASSYVYDDIWAGDGGLNPRDDIMGIAVWAASDPAGGEGVGVEVSKGEGASSAREAHSLHPGSTVGLDRGNELPRHGSGCQRRRRKLPQFGCDQEGGCAEGNGGRSAIHVEIPEGVYDDAAAAWEDKIDLGNSRKRRTPSPGSGRERDAGYCSTSVAAGTSGLTTSQWSSVPNFGRGQGGFCEEGRGGAPTLSLRESCKREVSSPQLSCCGSTSGASSGEDESFFAGRVLDPAPRPPRSSAFRCGGGMEGSKPDLSVDHPRGGGGKVDDDRAGAVDGGSGRRRLAEGGGSGSVSWPPEAAIAAAVVAGPYHLTASDQRKTSHIEKEAFFSRHALEPSPRLDWHREAIEESQSGNDTARHTVAKGIVVHRLTQGIGAPGKSAQSSATEYRCASSPESRGSPPPMQFPDRIGGSFRTAADARAWSRDSGKEVKERGKCESPREDLGSAAVGNNGVGGNCAGGDWEWQVQPEAMSAYFTNVIGLTPPDASNLYRSRSSPFGSSESLGRLSGVGGADTPESMTEVYQDLGATAGEDEVISRPDAGSGALDSCSTSCLAEAESGSDGDNSWGW